MSYVKKIEVYEVQYSQKPQRGDLTAKIPLASKPTEFANHPDGAYIVIIDDIPFVTDMISGRNEKFAQTSLSAEFIRNNPIIFTKIS